MKGVLAMILTGISLGTIGYFVKLIDANVHFMTLNFLRIFIGFLFLLLFVPLIDKDVFKFKKSDVKDFSLIGFLFALSLSLFTTALNFTTISEAVLINYSYPIFMLFFAYFLLKEKISFIKIGTIILALIGLFIINPISGGSNILGNFLAFLNSFFLCFINCFNEKI